MTMVLDSAAGITYPNSTQQASAGVILQVVYGSTTNNFSTSSTTVVNTGLSASITPKFSTSRVLVMVSLSSCGVLNQNCAGQYNLLRSGSNVSVVDYGVFISSSISELDVGHVGINYLDSPATTSSITYSTQGFIRYGTGTMTCGGPQTIVLMEVAG